MLGEAREAAVPLVGASHEVADRGEAQARHQAFRGEAREGGERVVEAAVLQVEEGHEEALSLRGRGVAQGLRPGEVRGGVDVVERAVLPAGVGQVTELGGAERVRGAMATWPAVGGEADTRKRPEKGCGSEGRPSTREAAWRRKPDMAAAAEIFFAFLAFSGCGEVEWNMYDPCASSSSGMTPHQETVHKAAKQRRCPFTKLNNFCTPRQITKGNVPEGKFCEEEGLDIVNLLEFVAFECERDGQISSDLIFFLLSTLVFHARHPSLVNVTGAKCSRTPLSPSIAAVTNRLKLRCPAASIAQRRAASAHPTTEDLLLLPPDPGTPNLEP